MRTTSPQPPRKLTEGEKAEVRTLANELQPLIESSLAHLSRADPELANARLGQILEKLEQHRSLILGVPV